jgi:hypothetical protein
VIHSESSQAWSPAREVALSLEAKLATGDREVPARPRSDGRVLFREQKTFMHPGAEENRLASVWVLDTGATNHMTGSRVAFQDLDTTVYGTIRFGDDSEAWIEGHGTVVFFCKGRERLSFVGLYFIPLLTTNILSIGQLDMA